VGHAVLLSLVLVVQLASLYTTSELRSGLEHHILNQVQHPNQQPPLLFMSCPIQYSTSSVIGTLREPTAASQFFSLTKMRVFNPQDKTEILSYLKSRILIRFYPLKFSSHFNYFFVSLLFFNFRRREKVKDCSA
jgi:hypothetical protein